MGLWTGVPSPEPFGPRRGGPQHLEAVERVKEWMRSHYVLKAEDVVLVTERDGTLPGCPLVETVVVFWSAGIRHHLKVFKPVEGVTLDDLPPPWMKAALATREGAGCDCC